MYVYAQNLEYLPQPSWHNISLILTKGFSRCDVQRNHTETWIVHDLWYYRQSAALSLRIVISWIQSTVKISPLSAIRCSISPNAEKIYSPNQSSNADLDNMLCGRSRCFDNTSVIQLFILPSTVLKERYYLSPREFPPLVIETTYTKY